MTKRLPYGIQDFGYIMEKGFYYVDKTRFIPTLENAANFLFFVRPRRFGKSLFISMLQYYYDSFYKERFNELFGSLWIGSHPTEEQGAYQVLRLDFSQIGKGPTPLEDRFNMYVGRCLNEFINVYKCAYPEYTVAEILATNDSIDKLYILKKKAKTLGIQLYLIVDEYDNFTNIVLGEQGEEAYHAITHADGFYRDIFKIFKGMFTRIMMMGVSPVTLNDLTSGYNIATNITADFRFNQLLGFSEEDVREMVTYYKGEGKLPADCDVDKIVADMKPWYDGYCFSSRAVETQSRVFNSDMVLYYMNTFVGTSMPPEQMLDENTKTDYNKLRQLMRLDKSNAENRGVIQNLAAGEEIREEVVSSFPASSLMEPQMLTNLLFYYGMLTIKGTKGDKTLLGIPNNNVRKQYYEYIVRMYKEKVDINTRELSDRFYSMAYDGNWRDAFTYLAEAYARASSVRDGIEAERNIQGFFMAFLSLNGYYHTAPELELNHGFCDFFLLPDLSRYAVKHCYIIELKILNSGDFAKRADAQWQEAVEQINGYAKAPRVVALQQGTALHKIILQFEGHELRRMEEVE